RSPLGLGIVMSAAVAAGFEACLAGALVAAGLLAGAEVGCVAGLDGAVVGLGAAAGVQAATSATRDRPTRIFESRAMEPPLVLDFSNRLGVVSPPMHESSATRACSAPSARTRAAFRHVRQPLLAPPYNTRGRVSRRPLPPAIHRVRHYVRRST